MRRDHDIKAPDGYLLAGLRTVRADGTILFHRMYWGAPKEWAGERVWVQVTDGTLLDSIEAARPGLHIYKAQVLANPAFVQRNHDPDAVIKLYPLNRRDAKPGYRNAAHKAWSARGRSV